MSKFLTALFIVISATVIAQQAQVTDQIQLQKLYQEFKAQEQADSTKASQLEKAGQVQVIEIDDKAVIGLVGFRANGQPIFYATDNQNAAKTVGTNLVVAGAANGYGLTGNGMIIGEWDGGGVRLTHQELTGRVTQVDNPSSLSDHSTHVAGTMIASGVTNNAKGMATAATIQAYDFSSDASEMATFAATNGTNNFSGLISNHSYGTITGWREMSGGTWRWYGDTTISATEDFQFGFYTSRARSWDLMANAAPYYLIVKSAGNDRNDVPPASVTSHEVWASGSGWVTSTVSRPQDGGALGYDCISSNGNAKNILTVGAVSDIITGWSQPSDVVMSSFSGWGPTDDGRIKPDIVANGVSLYSTGSSNNTDYYSSSGTSMSAPNATGSMALLQEMYNDSNASFMRAATLKALVIHTANEAGTNPGPDFAFGWGLLNIKGAADVIADTLTNKIIETSLANNGTATYTYYSNGLQDVVATIVWNDPAGMPVAESLDPTTSMLVNDLDLRISNASGTTKLPWTLNNAMPSNAAVKADNVKDNVEKVIYDSPAAGAYTFTITHKGSLSSAQNFSLIISGVQNAPVAPAPTVAFSGTPTTICEGDSVVFSETSTGNPTALAWTFTGGTPATSTSPSPVITYNTAGTYAVKLKATNANGSDSLTQTNYITVLAAPNTTTQPLSNACIGAGNVTLSGGLPAGGTWTGTGVNAGVFDPTVAGLGTHTLTYTATNGTCSSSSVETITVDTMPTVSLATPPPICSSSAPFTVTGGVPSGGTYSGTGITSNVFSPSTAGVGVHAVTYSFTDANGCSGTATANITVLNGTASSISAQADVCEGVAPFALSGGSPAGGYYTGLGVDTATGIFDPSVAGVGTHTITYFGAGGLCISAASTTITVNPLPTVSLSAIADVCISTASVTLSGGSPMGGTYSGTGVVAGDFIPATAGLGAHTIYYNYTDVNGCSGIDSTQVTVVNTINYTVADTTVCSNSPVFSIASGMPMGGTYSGTGVVSGIQFDPSAPGVGTHTITYTDAANACAVAGTATFTVTAIPTVTLDPFAPICLTGGPVNLTGGLPAGGTYAGVGITNNILDPTVNGVGTITITYTATANGCSASASQLATIDTGTPAIVNLNDRYCINDSAVTLVGAPAGGVFSGAVFSGNTFDPNLVGLGTHLIIYTSTGGCAGMVSEVVQVIAKPVIGSITGPMISSQNAVASYHVAAQNGASYNWIPTGGTLVTNANNQITVNWNANTTGNLLAIITNQNGCKDSTSVTVNLWPLNVAQIENDAIGFYPNPVAQEMVFSGSLALSGEMELVIYSILGKQEITQTTTVENQDFSWPVDVSSLASGTYFYTLRMNNEVIASGKFIKK